MLFRSHVFMHIDDTIYCETDGERYASDDRALENHDIYLCEHTGEYYHVDELSLCYNGLYVLKVYAIESIVDFESPLGSNMIDIDHAKRTPCGAYVHHCQYDDLINVLNTFSESEV